MWTSSFLDYFSIYNLSSMHVSVNASVTNTIYQELDSTLCGCLSTVIISLLSAALTTGAISIWIKGRQIIDIQSIETAFLKPFKHDVLVYSTVWILQFVTRLFPYYIGFNKQIGKVSKWNTESKFPEY